ncbi:aldo/keto reductase [Lactonifactor longoviformis]|uniref:aldo/keto reductase n=1 Tax=Lactonifactor longoviformis TaxID=341220 RepID=UPI0036F2CF79
MIPNFKLSNGVEVPAMGLGTFLTKNGEEAARCVCDAVKAGYRSIDTAMIYLNEEGVGKGIKECGIPRNELYLTTKLWNDSHGYEETLRAFDASLKRLGVDYIDEYLIHWPGQEGSFLPTWKAFERLYEEGVIRVIGVCNFMKPVMKELLASCNVSPMVNQIEIHPMFQPDHLIAFCQEQGIQVEAWRPIVWGKLEKDPILQAAAKYRKTPVQITLRWHYQRGVRTVPKTTHYDRMKENMDIFDFSLTEEEMEAINGLNTYVRTGESPDEFFGMDSF